MPKTKLADRKKKNRKKKKDKRPAPRGVSRTSAVQHIDWESVELEELNPLFRRQYVVGKNVMLSRIFLRNGSMVPKHSHHNEQISYVLEGALKFSIDRKEFVVRAGEVLLIPPNVPHKVEALEDTLSLDIFDPPRADWIDKTDDYLRKAK
jgi:quercetin dioxygenase-like cupin family protein